MKYVIVTVMDQTIGFATPAGDWTTKHPEALLLDSQEEAALKVDALNAALPTHDTHGTPHSPEMRERMTCWFEQVEDEAEFRARADTW